MTRALTPRGRANAFPTSGSGNTPRREPTGASTRGEMSGTPPPCRRSETRRVMRAPTDVDAYPQGASPFGVMDLVGNVWQWTEEFTDEHTRAGILRGGSYYQPQGSHWYFPQAYKLNEHGKYLLIAPSTDRSATVGFRCVVDAEG